MYATGNGHLEVAKLLLDKGAAVDAKDQAGVTSLMLAAQMGYLDVVKLLLEKKADIEARASDGATPLAAAVQKGNLDMARLLLEKGAAANYIGVSPLAVAVQTGNLQMAKLLLEKGAMIDDVVSTNNAGITPLWLAAEGGKISPPKVPCFFVRLMFLCGRNTPSACSRDSPRKAVLLFTKKEKGKLT